ncbi:MAG: hypothetical protein Q9219_006755 [cf. Caloplaca sp. 3 TL-2023]
MSDTRLSELREKLLASKRASSATPLPSCTNKATDTRAIDTDERAINPDKDVPPGENTQKKETEANASGSTTGRTTPAPKDKFLPNIPNAPNAPTSSSANADVQGLINEYRIGDGVKGPKSPSNPATKHGPSKQSRNPKANGVADGSNSIEKAATQSKIAKTPSKTLSRSVGSSESGEIRSDSISEVPSNEHPGYHGSAGRSASRPSTGPPNTTAQNTPQYVARKSEQTEMPVSLKPKTPRQTTVPSQSISSTSESRNVPSLPGNDHASGLKDISLAQTTFLDQPKQGPNGSHLKSRSHQSSSLLSPSARTAHNHTLQNADVEVEEHQQGSQQELATGGTNASKEQAKEQQQPPLLPKTVSNVHEEPSIELEHLCNHPQSTGSATHSEHPREKPQQHEQQLSVATVPERETNIMSRSQQELIQRLGIELTPEGLRDLYDFLDYHRFFVDEYREGFLARQRRLRALEAEKLALERESLLQYDHFNSMRAQTLATRESTGKPALPGLPDSKITGEMSSTKPMHPPLSQPTTKPNDGTTITIKGRASTIEASSPRHPLSRSSENPSSGFIRDGSNLKRQRLDDDSEADRSGKHTRMGFGAQGSNSQPSVGPRIDIEVLAPVDTVQAILFHHGRIHGQLPTMDVAIYHAIGSMISSEIRTAHYAAIAIEAATPQQNVQKDSGDVAAMTKHPKAVGPPHKATRQATTPSPTTTARRDKGLLAQSGEDSRYFMIKSWNVGNVEAAQRDCIWATQSKNLDVLTDAFNTCRNVILARMQTLPSPEIPAPGWQKALLWSSTDPFRIKWITVAETRFQLVGHLKNALNEGQAVLVGRDGQEIEGECGRALCELIDETARDQARYEDGY